MDLMTYASREFLGLTSGAEGARTTVALWFAIDGDRIVTVLADRRVADTIEEHPDVAVSFADDRRALDSDGAPAVARCLDAGDEHRIGALLNQKYGWRRRLFRFAFWFTRRLGSTWDTRDRAVEIRLT
jgi:hypothetical protein